MAARERNSPFFASTTHFQALHERYAKLGKRLRLTNLSPRNRRLLQRADASVTMDTTSAA